MIKSQKKVIDSYKPETINNYIFNWPINKIVINPTTIVGGNIKGKKLKAKLPPPLIPTPYVPPPKRPTPAKRRPRPKSRILSMRPIPLPRNNIPEPIRTDLAQFKENLKNYYKPEFIASFQERLNDVKNQIKAVKELDKALNDYAVSAEINIFHRLDPRKQFYLAYYWVEKFLKDHLRKNRGLKFSLALRVRFYKEKLDDNGKTCKEYIEGTFGNVDNPQVLTNTEEMKEKYDIIADLIMEKISKWLSGGSGLIIEEILNHYINVAKYVPLSGSSYIDLPSKLKNPKKGLINLKNKDDKCALWCIVRHLNPRKLKPERITLEDREFAKRYNLKGINFLSNV